MITRCLLVSGIFNHKNESKRLRKGEIFIYINRNEFKKND